MTEQSELLEICPLCGERITRCEYTDSAGTRRETLCCNAPLEIVDNWDVFSGLPEALQQVAIEKIKAEYAEMSRKSAENARLFKENSDRWLAECPDLFKGDHEIVPMHE